MTTTLRMKNIYKHTYIHMFLYIHKIMNEVKVPYKKDDVRWGFGKQGVGCIAATWTAESRKYRIWRCPQKSEKDNLSPFTQRQTRQKGGGVGSEWPTRTNCQLGMSRWRWWCARIREEQSLEWSLDPFLAALLTPSVHTTDLPPPFPRGSVPAWALQLLSSTSSPHARELPSWHVVWLGSWRGIRPCSRNIFFAFLLLPKRDVALACLASPSNCSVCKSHLLGRIFSFFHTFGGCWPL